MVTDMNNTEINNTINILNMMSYQLESAYIENEGECTEATEAMEAEICAIKDLLNTEGVDSLGRWLKAKEDEVKSLKAEKDYISRKIDAANNTIDYIKEQVASLMRATGEEKVKGMNGYSFTTTTSVKTAVDKDVLKDMFLDAVEKKLRGGRKPVIPEDVTITLGASVKALKDDSILPAYYTRTETPSCRFTKPRASKEA